MKNRDELLAEIREGVDELSTEMLTSAAELVAKHRLPNYCIDCGKRVHRTSHSLTHPTHRFRTGKSDYSRIGYAVGDKRSREYTDRPFRGGTTRRLKRILLRKLRKDSPEIHAKVIAGEISPHAGMVAAGFRKKTATVSVDPKSFATAILRRFTSAEIREIIEALEVGAL